MKITDELFFKTIKVFVTVAQEKSFSRAGERIGRASRQ